MKIGKLILASAMLAGIPLLQSCLKNNGYDYSLLQPNAVVTLKPDAKALIMQLDDKTALFPVNLQKSAYEKELRAFINFRNVREQEVVNKTLKNVYVNWVDTIRTKGMAPNLEAGNESAYGRAPLEILNDWATVCEDGYLTLRIRTMIGNRCARHIVNLVKGEGPYEVMLFHDPNGDTNRHGQLVDGYIAFRLDALPDTEGKTVDLTLKWDSFSGSKSAKFKYCTRK